MERRISREIRNLEPKSKLVLKELLVRDGIKNFKESLHQSQGHATFLIHPFFPEDEPRLNSTFYETYLESLKTSFEDIRDNANPVVIFEEEEKISKLKGRLEENGITTAEAFLVPTRFATPEPVYGTLHLLSEQFMSQGLKEATVIGSMLWKNPEGSAQYNGCVGRTIEVFTKVGIKTKLGTAVYPPL